MRSNTTVSAGTDVPAFGCIVTAPQIGFDGASRQSVTVYDPTGTFASPPPSMTALNRSTCTPQSAVAGGLVPPGPVCPLGTVVSDGATVVLVAPVDVVVRRGGCFGWVRVVELGGEAVEPLPAQAPRVMTRPAPSASTIARRVRDLRRCMSRALRTATGRSGHRPIAAGSVAPSTPTSPSPWSSPTPPTRSTASRFRANDLQVRRKPDTTHVTEADHAAEELIRAGIQRARPGDAILGEELGTEGDSRRRWIVDPIDGTANYVRGVPIWATLIALEEDGELRVGVASAPALHTRWYAARGEGAHANERRLAVSEVADLADAQLCYSDIASWTTFRTSAQPMIDLLHHVWRARGVGDFLQHMLVAEGAADAAVEPVVNLWDLAPLLVIVEEAGGRFTNLEGERTAGGGSAVSSNGLLHDDVLAALAAAGPAPDDESVA